MSRRAERRLFPFLAWRERGGKRDRWAAVVVIATVILICAARGQSPDRVLIDHVHILDGHGGPPVPGRVLITGERITQILPEGASALSGVTVVDGGAATSCPDSSTCTPICYSRDATRKPGVA
jgi:hypothetical protein